MLVINLQAQNIFVSLRMFQLCGIYIHMIITNYISYISYSRSGPSSAAVISFERTPPF